MVLDEPGDRLGLRRGQAEAGTEPAGDAGAGDRMVLGPALGDVVEKEGDVEGAAALHGADDLGDEGVLVLALAALQVPQHPMQRSRCSSTV